MAREDEAPLDMLTDKHELWPYNPDDAERTEVVAVEHGGRRLEVIVPLLYDGFRVGEVVTAAVAGETVFLLGRYDRPLSDDLGTPGLLVVAVPHRDGRYRAVIAHATYSLDGDGHVAGLGLHPAPGSRTGAGTDTGSTGKAPWQPPVMEEARALQRAVPFRPFLILDSYGGRFPVYGADYVMIEPAGGYLVASGPVYKMVIVDAAQIVAVRVIGPGDPEAIGPAVPI